MNVSARLSILALIVVSGCAPRRANTPLEPAIGSEEVTGFGRTESTVVRPGLVTTTELVRHVGQAASVEPGGTVDRLWRLSDDGLRLEHCRNAHAQCTTVELGPKRLALDVPLIHLEHRPTIVAPHNLGAEEMIVAEGDRLTWTSSAPAPGSLPATPAFGVWVSFSTGLGTMSLGREISFCHERDGGVPRCTPTNEIAMSIVGAFVLRPAGRRVHVIWFQAPFQRGLTRCEADDATGAVVCKKTKET